MISILSAILLNGKTSAMGAGAVATALASIYKTWPMVDMTQVGVIFAGLTGLFAKDHNVSGTGK
jgi:hypothetical protein